MARQSVKIPTRNLVSTSKLLNEADSFIKTHKPRSTTALPKVEHNVGEQFSNLIEKGYPPEHLVVTPKEVILDMEAIERNAFREALQESERMKSH
jgi:hypothetical protein